MTATQYLKDQLKKIPTATIFGYVDLIDKDKNISVNAITKALSQMMKSGQIKRISRGKYYIEAKGILGSRAPNDSEIIRSELFKKGVLNGYITGHALYNKLGLTTQIPHTITIAWNGGRKVKDYGTIKIIKLPVKAPINESNIKLLQYLDVLKDINIIMDSNVDDVLKFIKARVQALTANQQSLLLRLAINYYPKKTVAYIGEMIDNLTKT